MMGSIRTLLLSKISLRRQYQLRCWFQLPLWLGRRLPVNKAFDEWLWARLQAGDILHVGRYSVVIGLNEIWTGNYPYASGYIYDRHTRSDEREYCTRACALLLEHQRQEALVLQRLRGGPDVYLLNGDYI